MVYQVFPTNLKSKVANFRSLTQAKKYATNREGARIWDARKGVIVPKAMKKRSKDPVRDFLGF